MEGLHSYAENTEKSRLYVYLGLLSIFITPWLNGLLQQFEILNNMEPWLSSGPSFGFVYLSLYEFYIHVAWRWGWLRILLPAPTNLNGTYKGKLISSYKKGTEVPLTLEISQNRNKMVICMSTDTDTSSSYSYTASMFRVDGIKTQLCYSYKNVPYSAIADADMNQHDGTANLSFKNDIVIGHYFNARKRTGSIKLRKITAST